MTNTLLECTQHLLSHGGIGDVGDDAINLHRLLYDWRCRRFTRLDIDAYNASTKAIASLLSKVNLIINGVNPSGPARDRTFSVEIAYAVSTIERIIITSLEESQHSGVCDATYWHVFGSLVELCRVWNDVLAGDIDDPLQG